MLGESKMQVPMQYHVEEKFASCHTGARGADLWSTSYVFGRSTEGQDHCMVVIGPSEKKLVQWTGRSGGFPSS
jgi:hypothetical protein